MTDSKPSAEQVPISLEESRELQDILRTLTNSGTALITSARELIQSWNIRGARIDELGRRLAEREQQIEATSNLLLNCSDTLRVRCIPANKPLDERVIELAHRADRVADLERQLADCRASLAAAPAKALREAADEVEGHWNESVTPSGFDQKAQAKRSADVLRRMADEQEGKL